MNFRDRTVLFLATGFCIGNIPFAPGTFGALLGLPMAFGLAELGNVGAIAGVAAFVPMAIWIAGRAETLLEKKDASAVVIDEVVGMLITLVGLPLTVLNMAAGFAVFRALDIIKPFPARSIDRNIAGGWGIVLDDAVAGLYSNLLLRLMAAALGLL
jgi:phosphatidylglycerophosphatase A